MKRLKQFGAYYGRLSNLGWSFSPIKAQNNKKLYKYMSILLYNQLEDYKYLLLWYIRWRQPKTHLAVFQTIGGIKQ